VAPSFWTGRTGRLLRGDSDAQLVAMYLLTGPHSTMTGVFHCPVAYIATDTGLPLEGASKGLRRLCEVSWCSFDEGIDLVWVHEMARFQVGTALKANDNRVVAVKKEFAALPKCLISHCFFLRYSDDFHLVPRPDLAEFVRGSKGASKALRSQEQEQDQEQGTSLPIQEEETPESKLKQQALSSLGRVSFNKGAA
jgi:hypothetical protein